MTDLAVEFLDYYLHRDTPARHAVLLSGEWGSGKSWFIRTYLSRYAKGRKAQDPLWHEGYYYVSLFGKSSRADIAAALFTAAHPGLSNGYAQILGSTLSRVANTLTRGQAVKATDAAALQAAVTQLDGRALVFDDVERCSMPMEDLFGYINDLVEGSKLKVILIANEAELDRKHPGDYRPQKEKVVGKTVSVRSDPGGVYDALIMATKPEVQTALVANRDAALQVFKASGTNNFRSLQSAIDDFQHLVSRADPRFVQPGNLRTVFLYLLATTLEHRVDRLKKGELPQLEVRRTLRTAMGSKTPATDEEKRLQAIPLRYPSVAWSEPIVPPEIIDRLYTEGTLDVGDLNAHLLRHPKVVGQAQAPAWRTLVKWRTQTRADYVNVRDRVVAELMAGETTHPGVLLHLMATSLSLERNGETILPGGAVVFFHRYIIERLRDGTIQPVVELLDPFATADSWDGIPLEGSGDPDFKRLNARLMAALRLAVDARFARQAPELLAAFQAGAFEAISPFADQPSAARTLPALQHIPVSAAADLIIGDELFHDGFMGALVARHNHYRSRLRRERSWIAALHAELVRRAAAASPPQQAHLTHLVGYWFKGLI